MDEKRGLSESEAKQRLLKYGFNELKEKKKITLFKVFLSQLLNIIIWVLFAAAIISFFIGEILSFWVVIFIIGFVIILGMIQEYKAEKAMDALKKIVQLRSKVLRDGKERNIFTREVVPGDILFLESGDKIPADAKVFDSITVKVDESALTGESIPVEKKDSDVVFAGTQVVYGKCRALVLSTGMETKLGEIAGLVQVKEEKTPLQIKITSLSKKLAIIALVACLITLVVGLLKGAPFGGILIISLALAVAAVPEGLPLTLTLTLAYGMKDMAKNNAIVRKMLGVETLGSTTIICTDKTGTLTKNEMTVQKIWTGDNEMFDVTGVGYGSEGEFLKKGKKANLEKEKNLNLLIESAVLCNNSFIEEDHGSTDLVGDPTEGALVVMGNKAGLFKDELEKNYKRIKEIIFTSERKLMSVVYQMGRERKSFAKGAPEVLLEKCKYIKKGFGFQKLSKAEINKILSVNKKFANQAYRVLGIAYKSSGNMNNSEEDLVFLGLVAMIDPPREEVSEAIVLGRKAGIKSIMITGDNEDTARAIAKQINLFNAVRLSSIKNAKLRKIVQDGAITGSELNNLQDNELYQVVEKINVYARIMPEQKLRIVEALKKKGHVVAMTGDGVNDAPALKKSDIGIAMGIKGTDVARESSVITLQDDNFATIVEAVKKGRAIYENIEKFTCYLISRNFTEVILILFGILFLGFDLLPLLALQILFINTFDEIMPAIALGLDPVRKNIMNRKPRNPKERILNRKNLILVLSLAVYMAVTAFLVFYFNNPLINLEKARTLTFTTIISMILFVPFIFRSLDESILKVGVFSNKLLILGVVVTLGLSLGAMYIPFFRGIFELTKLSFVDWIIPVVVAFSSVVFAEIIKKCCVRVKK